jgi:hypothetical protein
LPLELRHVLPEVRVRHAGTVGENDFGAAVASVVGWAVVAAGPRDALKEVAHAVIIKPVAFLKLLRLFEAWLVNQHGDGLESGLADGVHENEPVLVPEVRK